MTIPVHALPIRYRPNHAIPILSELHNLVNRYCIISLLPIFS